ILFTLVLYSAPHHQHLHSFPTRRSSDLRQVSALPRRGPLGAATAQSPLVVGNGARLDRSVLEAPADGSPLMGEPFLKTLTRTAVVAGGLGILFLLVFPRHGSLASDFVDTFAV